jgi:hypothetical protein
MADREYLKDSCLIITDAWAPTLGSGDVDDWVKIILAAKTVKFPVFYIVNDNIRVSRPDQVTALGLKEMILKINPNAMFLDVSTPFNVLQGLFIDRFFPDDPEVQPNKRSKRIYINDILVGARVTERDPHLRRLLDSLPCEGMNIWAQGVGPYNFNMASTPDIAGSVYANLDGFAARGARTQQFPSNTVNRRLPLTDLLRVISDPAVDPGETRRFYELMKAYAVAKTICLPAAPFIVGLLVDRGGPPYLGNNLKGLLAYLGIPKLPTETSYSETLRRYIQSKDPTVEVLGGTGGGGGEGTDHARPSGRNLRWVHAQISKMDPAKLARVNVSTHPEDVQDSFYEGLALAIHSFEQWSGQRLDADFKGDLPTLADVGGRVNFTLPDGSISSPLWDGFFFGAWLHDQTPAMIDAQEGAPDVMLPPSTYMRALIGLGPDGGGGGGGGGGAAVGGRRNHKSKRKPKRNTRKNKRKSRNIRKK